MVDGSSLQLATFAVDATPAVGDPIAYGTVDGVDDPLSCRGVVLFPTGQPIVLAAIDWIGNYNGAHKAWQSALADAAGTSPERVAMHAVHQHEAPGFDPDTETLLLGHGIEHHRVDAAFARETIRRAAAAVGDAITDPEPVSHVGIGSGEVTQVASNRQVLGEDGTCCYVRYTSGGQDFEFASSAPEGVIDPVLRTLSFWREDEALAALTYYATHPQSYYRNGLVSCDFPGIARNRHQAETGVFHVHFNGAAGNVTAGKYNDGSEENRLVLAQRLMDGMADAWENTERQPVDGGDVRWEVERVAIPPAPNLNTAELIEGCIDNPDEPPARKLIWKRRCDLGDLIPLTCLHVNDASVIHMPGELFVEYQLAAQRMQPDRTVMMAAYGDGGPGYMGTRAAYPLGGYEINVSKVSPKVEDVLTPPIRRFLDAEDATVTPSDITAEKPRTDR